MLKLLRTALLCLSLLPFTATAAELVNINSADVNTLQQVKGIGPALAKKIVDYRQANGPFASVEDLVKVPGIGEKSVKKMAAELTVGAGATALAPKAPAATPAAPAAPAVTAKK